VARLVGYSTHKLLLGSTEHGPEWLVLRDQLSYFEQQRLNSSMLDVDIRDGETNVRADPGRYQPAILTAYISGWQLFDDDGNTIPFSLEALTRLDAETAQTALDHIDERAQLQEQKKANGVMPVVVGETFILTMATSP
jgi:hypothetical protein